MSPEKPAEPGQGKPAEEEQIEAAAAEAKEAAAQEKASAAEEPGARKRPRIRRKAADKAGKADAGEPAPKASEKKAAARTAARAEAKAAEPTARARAGAKAAAASGAAKAAEPAARASEGAKPAARARRGGAKPLRRRVVRARARYVRTSARKARMVCGHLRGKSVPEARAILAFTPREVARDWSKLLESAVANAESNHELLEDDLVVREAYADEGPTIKRFRPRAMGRATPIHKRTSHLTITLVTRP
jgi:ribosomal protein L22